MNINLTAKSSAITLPMKNYALDKVQKLEKYFDRIQKIDVVLNTEKERKIVEIVAFAPGSKMVASSAEDDIHASIDLAVDKMEAQLVRFKSKLKDHRRKDNHELHTSPPEPEEEKEETYQEIVDKTDFGTTS